ncbi:putative ribonuclease H-like domain-containing protein [Tanacetum coccineum]
MARETDLKKQRVFNTGNKAAKPVWNNANRVNRANHFVPRPVKLNAGRSNVNTGRAKVNSVKSNVNSVRNNVNSSGTNVNYWWYSYWLLRMKLVASIQNFIRQIENQLSHRVKIMRLDNGTEFKNMDMLEFCGNKGIKQEYSNARTP